MPAAVTTLLVALVLQGTQPLKKSDLIRLLSAATLAPAEVAELVRRHCLTFAPSTRDKADLRALGADDALMRRIDECARRDATLRATELRVRPAPVVATPSRTGFVSGLGQRGRVGTRLALPLVFEARDDRNAPVIGHVVTLTTVNARVESAEGATDSAGRVRAFVVLGERAGPVRVTATLGRIAREATLVALPGPPARLVVRCGTAVAGSRLVLAPGSAALLEVTAQDAFGNTLMLTGMRVSVGDDDVVQAGSVSGDSTVGRFSLRAGRAGATNLVVLASGVRESLVAFVSAREPAACRGGASRD